MFRIKLDHKYVLSQLPPVLKSSLNLPDLWIRSTEYYLNDNERADMVFQDKYDSRNALDNVTCYAVELKIDKADHSIVGQIQKAVEILHEKGTRTKHWQKTLGITVAKDYTETALKMLNQLDCIVYKWYEFKGKIELRLI